MRCIKLVYEQARNWFLANWDPSMSLADWWRSLAESGWGYPHWPDGQFGKDMSHEQHMEVERARVAVGAIGVPNDVSVTLVAPTLMEHGPEILLDRYLESIATGQEMWCQLFSEPDAGSDLAGLTTSAERDGDRWIINGSKVWTTGGHASRRAVLMARTDPKAERHSGISFFILDMEQPGVSVSPLRDMTGDEEFNQVFLHNAEVDHQDIIGGLGEGWRVAMTMLQHERDADAVGHDGGGDVINQVDLDAPVGQVQEEQQRGGTTSGFFYATGSVKDDVTFNMVKQLASSDDPVLGETATKAKMHRELLDLNSGRDLPPSVGKLLNSALCRELRDLGFAAGPASQLSFEDSVDGGHFLKSALFAAGMSIAGGTDEIQRNIIGERVLGLPREPAVEANADRKEP
ncbi:MAG: acyl-CoA dehydrogenase family protein [Actinomycetota bacterium]|nr:acyl-CoA dehydrogenase family protein [Actinomycetota bacterium]